MTELCTLIQYLLLGLVQGITEPIPISSSGHIIIVRELFGIEARGLSFEIFVNFASLLAVLLIYRHDIYRLIKNGILFITKKDEQAKSDFQFILYLVIGTIPVGVVGLLFGDVIGEALSNTKIVGFTLLITAVAIWMIRNLRGRKKDGDLTSKDAVIVGLAQAVAVTPGISRSGASIVASMLVGMKQETALRFSFLLYIPVSLGTTMLEVPEIVQDPNFDALMIPYLIAFIAAFIATYFALKALINIMAKGNLAYFSYYCVVVGVLVILFL
ncbi:MULTISPECIES: undecaprenyl-diphosphate phosphatase [Staphylococcaceae]|nr:MULTISPECIES: undecaprenyl-diphosphate phosphatase [Staphylococcus]MCG2317574.1 undecaprenyl-diphosphate phosphatase [Staphylococcus epidermidis]MCQ9294673.1 undecaprenyl-diphosphate phosphatase [Staphylococcus cohnii]NLK09747.1 undecaprenyl-diphosphate phosphatase [Staphylococcus equorum]HAP2020733.1 undecaprenyl-diphosphate phosphatase [Escherichia coli]HLR23731.1 undecaprenyl-diphosphate phosphatase [Pseudogracilibacillus sp.]